MSFKVGTKLQCVKTDRFYEKILTEGKTYTVVSPSLCVRHARLLNGHQRDQMVTVLCDDGVFGAFYGFRFVEVEVKELTDQELADELRRVVVIRNDMIKQLRGRGYAVEGVNETTNAFNHLSLCGDITVTKTMKKEISL